MPEKPKVYSYIRFSTPEQRKGDSSRRQLELAENWAKKNGLTLDNKLKDDGLSAFHGAHKETGKLGGFLRKVEAGAVPPGSYLVVESLDRLSREGVMDAFSQFREITKAGIRIVTLADQKEYSYERLNTPSGMSDLLMSVVIMTRANEESAMKSQRLGAAWEAKRRNAENKPITGRVPAWLRLNKKTAKIEAIPEKAETVRRIFEMSKRDMGLRAIAVSFNRKGIKPLNPKSKNWYPSYIKKVVHNRAVLGEFQPHRLKGRKRVPEGDSIVGYYPAVVDKDLFHEVHARLRTFPKHGGRTGKISSLFTGLSRCGNCYGSMVLINKGKPPKGARYLVCSAARRGSGCRHVSIRYDEIENDFLEFVTELDFDSVLAEGNSEREKALSTVRGDILSVDNRLSEQRDKLTALDGMLPKAARSESLQERLMAQYEDAENTIKVLEEGLKVLKQRESELSTLKEEAKAHFKAVKSLREGLKSKTGEDLIDLRSRLRSEINRVVEKIDLFPEGLGDRVPTLLTGVYNRLRELGFSVGSLENIGNDPDIFRNVGDYDRALESAKSADAYVEAHTGRDNRSAVIWFRNGSMRAIKWDGNAYVWDQETTPEIWNELMAEYGTVKEYLEASSLNPAFG